jgi:site-specific DNA-methyltransferase (adenine-specific)
LPRAPGKIRDPIIDYLSTLGTEASVSEIRNAVAGQVGKVAASSVRSYLNLNTPKMFERTDRGRYRLRSHRQLADEAASYDFGPIIANGKARLFGADCFDWLARQEPLSIHAVVTDPPYGLIEYTEKEQAKLRNGRGGVWRIPPSFDGHKRAPLPRFTVLDEDDLAALYGFFKRFGALLGRVMVPGGNIIIASNPLLSHIVADAMAETGLEIRGTIVRLVMTMRGGDRPKNAHTEFEGVSVMPRSMWEPWVVLRKPIDGRVQDNLRRWKTGGFRRISSEKPFGDVIKSRPTLKSERAIAPHPSLKPQSFLRQIVRAALPLGKGIVLDPFAGSGSTLAAANAVDYESIGVESDTHYIKMAAKALPKLSSLAVEDIDPVFS